MADPIRFVAIGDLHTGSTTGLAPKSQVRTSQQEWLLEKYNQSVRDILKGGKFVLGLGADLVDGHHHNSRQVWGNSKEQRDAAIELLQPLANKALWIYGLLGTEAHGGDNGENDNQIAQELGAKPKDIDHHHWIDIDGKILSISHHGMTVPKSGWLDDSGIISAIRQSEYDYISGRSPYRPDCLISHHCHRSPHPVFVRGIVGGVAGCWQLPTAHGAKISPRRSVDIGFLVWHPAENRLERVIHAQTHRLAKFKSK